MSDKMSIKQVSKYYFFIFILTWVMKNIVPGESSFTARAKTPTSNQFKILKKRKNDCVLLQNNL
jgi:hypothetical protein